MPNTTINFWKSLPSTWNQRFSPAKKRLWSWIKTHRLTVLAICSALLVLVTGLAVLTREESEIQAEQPSAPVKVAVKILNGEPTRIQTTATVKNQGVVTLVAQTAGPVKTINLVEGNSVKKSVAVLSQETGYGTGNAAYIGTQIATKNLEISDTTLSSTRDTVRIARETADRNKDNTEELRKINQQSIDGTRKVLDTTRLVIQKIEADIAASTDPATIQGLRQQLITYQNILVSTENQLKTVEYSTDTSKPPTALANLSKDQIYATTELQLRTAQLSRDIAELNLKSAQLTASLNTVRTPFAGKIERIYVSQGQYLTPGTPVAKISGEPQLCLVITVSGQTAQKLSLPGVVRLNINEQDLVIPITHISSTPTSGSLFEVLAIMPESTQETIFDGQVLDVELEGSQLENTTITGSKMIPLEAVFVTSLETYVFLSRDGKAVKTEVTAGEIIGNDIQIVEGLESGDHLILDRRVIDGQHIEEQIEQRLVEERG